MYISIHLLIHISLCIFMKNKKLSNILRKAMPPVPKKRSRR